MKNNFQSKAVPRGTRTIWRYLSALFLLFSLSIGNVWAELTAHTPGTYEKAIDKGGYGATIVTVAERDYEVYGFSYNSSGTKPQILWAGTSTNNASASQVLCSNLSATPQEIAGWISMSTAGKSSTYSMPSSTEFAASSVGSTGLYQMKLQGHSFTIKVKGYDQFSFLGNDNNGDKSKGKYLQVTINGSDVTKDISSSTTVRRYDLNSSIESTIVITGLNTSNEHIDAFSLRLPVAPTCSTEISTQPSGATLAVGDANPELSIVATNVASYAWKESSDGTSYDGASSLGSSASFTPSVNDAVQTKYYYCEVTSSCDGAAVSKSDIVTVNVVGAISYYTVTLNPAGGTIVDATGWTLNAGNYEKEVAEGTVLTLPTFTKTDRAFKTWRKAGPADVASPVTVDGDLSLTAIWTATIESVIYSWEGAEGGATETGGTATGSVDGLINVAKSGYYCLQINGNTSYDKYVQITLSGEEKVKTGDKIRYTGFYTNTETKNAAVKMRASGGTAIFTGANLPRIEEASPRTDTYVVPEGINTASVQITRHQTQTSSFLTKLQIVREVQVEEGDLLTVTFDANGGSAIAPVVVASGQAVAKPADPTKAHNRFNEWQLSGSTYNFSTPVTANITLVANWTPLYTVTYAANGGSGTMTDANEYAAGDEVTLLENTFEAPDVTKIWDSWAVTDALDNPVSVSAGKFAMPSSSATVTAQWTTISDFDVKFFQGYGDPDVQIGTTQSISTGEHATAPTPDPTREGYNFKGWSYDATEAHIVDVASYAITAATNFTAIWKQVFAVTFDGAGSVNVESGSRVASPDSPSQAGKVFQGWYNAEVKYDFSAAVTDNLALTSKWADADANHYIYAYDDDFHFDGVVYKTPDGKTKDPEAAEASNVALATNPYTLFSGAAGITSIIATNGIYDYKKAAGTKHITAYLKLKADDATSNVMFTIASGYTAVLKLKMNGYSSNATISLKKGDDAVTPSGTQEGTAEGKNYGELTYNLTSGEYKLTTANKTLYISHIDFEATAIPAKVVTYKAGEGTGDDVVDDNATEVLDCPNSFTAPEGKIFNGWKDALDNDVAVGTIVEADMELTAQWIAHYAVTFNMQGHGDDIAPQDIKHGAKAAKPADPTAADYDFGGWFTDAECTAGNEFDFNTPISAATELFAKWTVDPCISSERKSLSKVVLTSATEGTVTGFNSDEYAGSAVIESLKDDGTKADIIGDATQETGYKLNSGGKSIVFATLKKGDFQEGDRVIVGVIKKNDQRTVDESTDILTIYAGSDKDHILEVATVKNVSNPGFYTYRLTAANVTAINTAGYKSIGVFRASDNGENHYIYSVEIQGCRSWAIFHTLTFKNIDGTATIAAEPLEEGVAASTVAPIAPKIDMKRFLGWSESVGGALVDLTSYTISADATLYAVYEDIVCPTTGTVYKFVVKDGLASENLLTSTDKDMSSYVDVTGDGYLTYTATADNKATVNSDGTIQLKDATAAYLKVELECTLTAGDQIRSNISNNPMRVQVATTFDADDDLILAKNVYNTVDITSAMVGKNVLYIARSTNGNANIADFEIYRPAKFDVSFNMMGHGSAIADIENVLEGSKISAPTAPTDENYSFSAWYKENELENEWDFDNDVVVANTTLFAKWINKSDATLKSLKYGDTEIALEDGVYTYEVNVPGFLTAVPALTAVTSNPSAIAAVTDATEFDGEGKATSTVEVTPEKEGAAHQIYTVKFTKLPLYTDIVDVTGYTEWNWAGVATAEVKINDVANRGVILANYIDAPNFEMLAGQENARAYRNNSYPAYQGTYLKFHATVPGRLTINARNSSGSPILRVNGIDLATLNGTRTNYVTAVPAGDVEITSSADEIRIYAMTFDPAVDYTRDVTEGKYGTICLPTNGVMIGTTIYTLAFYGATSQKIFFDEVVTGRMEAGKPYLFLPEQGVNELKVFYTDSETKDAQTVNGFVGYIGASEDADDALPVPAGAGNYIVQNNTYREVQAGATAYILSHRAYIHFDGISTTEPAKAPGARRIGLGKDEAQGFENLQSGDQPMKVMIDGTLYIIRGEKVYNANGQVVK